MSSGTPSNEAGSTEPEPMEPAPEGSRVRDATIGHEFDTPLSQGIAGPTDSVVETPRRVPVLPNAETTPVEGAPIPKGSDTLLSVPAPADRLDLLVEDRLTDFQDRLDMLEARLTALEKRPAAPETPVERSWWVWVAFLFVLAVGWKLLEFLR